MWLILDVVPEASVEGVRRADDLPTAMRNAITAATPAVMIHPAK